MAHKSAGGGDPLAPLGMDVLHLTRRATGATTGAPAIAGRGGGKVLAVFPVRAADLSPRSKTQDPARPIQWLVTRIKLSR